MLLFCLFVLYFRLIIASRQLFQLDELNPSYAIHGKHLSEKQRFTATGCENCTFLIDYAIRDCQVESLIATHLCNDSIPLRLNSGTPSYTGCTTKFDIDDEQVESVYNCHYSITKDQLLVEYRDLSPGEVGNDFFGLSIRVKEWVEDGEFYLIPEGANDAELTSDGMYWFQLILKVGQVATIVPWATPLEDHPRGIPNVYLGIQNHPDDCKEFIEKTPYYLYLAGSSPGKTFNSRNLLYNLSSYLFEFEGQDVHFMAARVLSSVVSIVKIGKGNCERKLLIKYDQRFNAGLLNHEDNFPTLMMSVRYPWSFDEPDDLDLSYGYGSTTWGLFNQTVLIDRLENGALDLSFSTYNYRESMNYSFATEDVNGYSFEVPAYDTANIWASFRPGDPNDGPRGYLMRTFPYHKSDFDICIDTVYLTPQQPSFAFDRWEDSFAGGKPNCFVADNCEGCHLLVDLCSNGSINLDGVLLDGLQPGVDECLITTLPPLRIPFSCCRLRRQFPASKTIIIQFHLEFTSKAFPFFRLAEFVDADANIVVQQCNNAGHDFRITADPIRQTFLILLIRQLYSPDTLDMQSCAFDHFWWKHSDVRCDYELYVDGVPGSFTPSDQMIYAFNELDEQLLTSSVYVFSIPPGCSPEINGLRRIQEPQNFIRCDGMALAQVKTPFAPYAIIVWPYDSTWTCRE